MGYTTGVIGHSYDGVNWVSVITLALSARAVAWNGILWVAGGDAGSAYSYDGVQWTTFSISSFSGIRSIVWNGFLWLIGGTSIAYSSDAVNWTVSSSATSVFTTGVQAIAWNGSLWVAGGGNGAGGSKMGYSTNGITWTEASTGSALFSPGIISAITWNGSRWIAGGQGDTSLAYSYNGITWADLTSGSALTSTCTALASRRVSLPPIVQKPLTESFIIAGDLNNNRLMYSYDGISWTPSATGNAIFITYNWDVEWNGIQWLAGGTSATPIAYSPDGIHWTGASSSSIFITDVRCMAWNGSFWIAMGGTVVGLSYDGINWTSVASLNIAAHAIAWNGILWIAGGSLGSAYSYDGVNWTTFSIASFAGMKSIAWNGFLWLVGGTSIAYSYDGLSWTISSSATSVFTTGVAAIGWNGSLWVAGGGDGEVSKVGYSTNGINWTEAATGSALFADGIISAVTWNGSRWIMGGYGTTSFAYSYNGITWSSLASAKALTSQCTALASRRPLPFSGNAANSALKLNVGNTLRVDAVYGNDSTASIGGSPYRTVQAAVAASSSGQTILVATGTYTLSTGITLPAGVSLRGQSVQTTIIQLVATGNQTLLTMGENTRVEDLTFNLTSTGHYTLIGVAFGGTTTATAKLRTSVVTVNNSSASTGGSSTVTGVLASGTGSLGAGSFSFNSLKGSTISVYSNGGGNKRGVLVNNTNIISTRDVNIYVAQPTTTSSTGSYVGVETADANNTGSIQLRATTIGVVTPTSGQTYTASDILQTNPTTITNPTYLASAGIQIGPGTDLVTKSAGEKGFSTFIYPTIVYYGLKGMIKDATNGAYLWPGTQAITGGIFPDSGTPPAYYRIQQPCLLSGISAGLNQVAGTGYSVTLLVKYTPIATGTVTDTPFTVTFGAADLVQNFYNASVRLATGDRIHLYITYTGNNANIAHDLTVQLDTF
jgi:hypothetical protein